MPHDDADASQIKQHGWRQGSVLPQSLVDILVKQKLLPTATKDRRFVVISHHCDVTNLSFEIEPNVELLRATVLPSSEKEGSYAWGKHPRFYRIRRKAAESQSVWEFSIQDRFSVPRTYLTQAEPGQSETLESDEIRNLANWLARRYTRVAFPDAFDKRTRRAIEKLRKHLKKEGELLTAIFILVLDDELPDDTPYEIQITGSMRPEDYNHVDRRRQAQTLLNRVEEALDECDGIDVSESHLKSEVNISLDDLSRLNRWDFDDLTIRGQPVSELPPRD
jgi:hypothetical protein